jgi:plastocyanin
MNKRRLTVTFGLLFALLAILAGLGAAPPQAATPAADTATAEKLWQTLQTAKYQAAWTLTPKGKLYQGQPPHGALLTTYLNPEAAAQLKNPTAQLANGSIIVKENYGADQKLAALTVMMKQTGYAPDDGDWFWAAYAPDGKVQMAGQVEYCYQCHAAAKSNDYVFTFPHAMEAAPTTPEPVATADAPGADKLWKLLQDAKYQDTWTLTAKGKLYTGQPPHGAFLTTYLNKEAAAEMAAKTGMMPDGAVIVKENYGADKKLAALTVMMKQKGIAPDDNDWFYAAFAPDGKAQMAGPVEYCYRCHTTMKTNDYMFSFPIGVEKTVPMTATVPAPAPTTAAAAPAAQSAVTIENFAFAPASLTIKVGTTVVWTNKDGATHTVTSTSGPEQFDSGRLADGKTFSQIFTKAGTYTYHCQIHSSMTGTIKVE